jgi:hypothetical protein
MTTKKMKILNDDDDDGNEDIDDDYRADGTGSNEFTGATGAVCVRVTSIVVLCSVATAVVSVWSYTLAKIIP